MTTLPMRQLARNLGRAPAVARTARGPLRRAQQISVCRPPWCSRVDRPASRALDDHDLADAVGPRPRSTGDQGRRDKKSDHEQQGQNPKSESHPISLKCEDPFLDS